VFAATALVWPNSRCCSESAILEAQQVALQLDIEHWVIDVVDAFDRDVVRPFVEAYYNGKTPNPCTCCNRYSRFSVFFERAQAKIQKKYSEIRELHIATGHYLSVAKKHGRFLLEKGKDPKKDQSYMLYDLTQEQLSRLITPLGKYKKADVRKLAKKVGLSVHEKPDSMEACFTDGDYRTFILNYTDQQPKPGDFILADGTVIGKHQGIPYYTIGQRRGLNLSWKEPLYVLELDPKKNRVVLGTKKELLKNACLVKDINWLITKPQTAITAAIKIRYNTPPVPGKVSPDGRIELCKPVEAITPGQVAAFYQGKYLIGGGIIQ
jgi:tRNA-specific 2-thiouridylase